MEINNRKTSHVILGKYHLAVRMSTVYGSKKYRSHSIVQVQLPHRDVYFSRLPCSYLGSSKLLDYSVASEFLVYESHRQNTRTA